MSLIDAAYFQGYHKQKEADFPTDFIGKHIPNAEVELMLLTGDLFDEMETLAGKDPGSLDTKETRKLTVFKNAAAELVMASVIPQLNLVVTDGGVLQSNEQSELGTTVKVLSPSQTQKLIAIYKDKAERLISVYLPSIGGLTSAWTGEE